MTILHRRYIATSLFTCMLLSLLVVGCGGTTQLTPKLPPTPTPSMGQQLLTKVSAKLNAAKTLHGIFNMTINGQTFNGNLKSEVWNATQGRSRVEVDETTLPQAIKGELMVTDGQHLWQYDPEKNVVYSGPVPSNANGTQGSIFAGGSGGQSQFLLTIIETIFSHSAGTLQSSSAQVNGQDVYDVHVVPLGDDNSAGAGTYNYTGEVYIDKHTQLPVKVDLNIDGIGQVVLNLSNLELNQKFPDSLFTLQTPAGATVLPLPTATPAPDTGALTLVQAQDQAGYHLLSIPSNQADYELDNVTALGSPGSQTFSLNYMKGNLSITIAEGRPLAGLPATGTKIGVRSTTGSFAHQDAGNTLTWTEHGIGIQITSALNSDQIVALANALV